MKVQGMGTKTILLLWIVASVFLLSPNPVAAAGFYVYEQGTKASTLAGAFIAQADDPSALFYNPAGITQLDGAHLLIGTTSVIQESEYPTPINTIQHQQERDFLFPSSLYYTYQLNDRLTAGVAFYSPFEATVEWKDGFPGAFSNRRFDLSTLSITPSLAVKLSDTFSIGVGLSYITSDVVFERTLFDIRSRTALAQELVNQGIPAVVSDIPTNGSQIINGEATDFAFNIGFRLQPNDRLAFGLTYRSGTELSYELEDTSVVFNVPATGNPSIDFFMSQQFPSGRAETALDLPDLVALGIFHRLSDRMDWEFDLTITRWSTFETFPLNYLSNTLFLVDENIPKVWDDSISLRLGAQFHITERWDFRTGIFFDETPIPDQTYDPSFPGGDRISGQLGGGFQGEQLSVDLMYMALAFSDVAISRGEAFATTPTLTGEYSSFHNLFGIQFGWHF